MGTITDKLNKLVETKSAIKTAIVNKGVTVTDTDTFASYADKINSISSGGYDFDFTVLGYNQEECKDANDIANVAITLGDFTQSQITEAIAYGKELYDSNYNITDDNVDKNKLLFYPKLKLPYRYKDSKVLYIPNVEYSSTGSYTSSSAYTNYLLYKVGSINAEFTNSQYSQGFFTDCNSLREVGDINITGRAIIYYNFFQNCYALRKIGNMNTTGSISFENMFSGCISITSIPQLDTSSGTNFNAMFSGCSSLTSIPQLDTSKGTNFGAMFNGCKALTSVPQLDTSSGTNFSGMFSNCSSITTIQQIDTSSGTNFNGIFSNCLNLKRIEGISLKSLNKTVGYFYLTGYRDMNYLRYALIKDIGTCTDMTSISFTYWPVWGVEDETSPDARQSLIDSLLTYSFDRATAGYSTCTITLLSYTKALLTEDEIAQITSKGYTIA